MVSRKLLPTATASPRRPVIILALKWYSSAIHRGIVRYAHEAGWILDIRMLRTGQIPSVWKGDGVLCNLQMDPQLDRMAEKAAMPVVNIGNLPHPRIPRVCSDNEAVGKMAADYFLQRGFKKFAFFAIARNSPGERIRLESFRKRVESSHGTFHVLQWKTANPNQKYSEQELSRWLARELARLDKPLAVFAEFDDPACEVLEACVTARIEVPEQVAVLGVGNDPLRCDFASVQLSSLDDDGEMIGYQAAQLLGRMIAGEKPPSDPILVAPKGITTRHSTDVLAVEHPLVALALRAIWNHFTEQIGAKQIAAKVPMSYRRLHDLFLRNVGRTIGDEITRKRLERAQQLLLSTKKKTIEISWLAGFSSYERMSKVFRRVLNTTPSDYRRRYRQAPNPPSDGS